MNLAKLIAVIFCFGLLSVPSVQGGAVNFQEPTLWSVGDTDSTFQEWNTTDAGFLGSGDTPPSDSSINPATSATPAMNVVSPGFVPGSGSYYSHGGDYSITADVFNHEGSAGMGGPYATNYGTRVLVQTAATINDDPNEGGPGSILQDSLKLVQHDGTPIAGGDNQSMLRVLDVSSTHTVPSPVGPVIQQELIYEFWLPGFTGDFRVEFDLIVHVSFQHLRIDTLIMEAVEDANFDQDGDVDGADFLVWQRGYGNPEEEATLENGNADLDYDVDAQDLIIWGSQYASGGVNSILDVSLVPEPSGLLLLGTGGLYYLCRGRRKGKGCRCE